MIHSNCVQIPEESVQRYYLFLARDPLYGSSLEDTDDMSDFCGRGYENDHCNFLVENAYLSRRTIESVLKTMHIREDETVKYLLADLSHFLSTSCHVVDSVGSRSSENFKSTASSSSLSSGPATSSSRNTKMPSEISQGDSDSNSQHSEVHSDALPQTKKSLTLKENIIVKCTKESHSQKQQKQNSSNIAEKCNNNIVRPQAKSHSHSRWKNSSLQLSSFKNKRLRNMSDNAVLNQWDPVHWISMPE